MTIDKSLKIELSSSSSPATMPAEKRTHSLSEDAKSPVSLSSRSHNLRVLRRSDTPGTFATDDPLSPQSVCNPFIRRDFSPKFVANLDSVGSRFASSERALSLTPRVTESCVLSCSSSLDTPRSTLTKSKQIEDPELLLAVVEECVISELEPVREEDSAREESNDDRMNLSPLGGSMIGSTIDANESQHGSMIDAIPMAITPQVSLVTLQSQFTYPLIPKDANLDIDVIKQELNNLFMRSDSSDFATTSTQATSKEVQSVQHMALTLDDTAFGSPSNNHFIQLVPGMLPMPQGDKSTPTPSLENNFGFSPLSNKDNIVETKLDRTAHFPQAK